MATDTNLKWEAAKQADSASQASKVVNALTIQLNGKSQGAYNGSAAKTVNITPSSIGAATSGHSHSNYASTNHTHDIYLEIKRTPITTQSFDSYTAPGLYYIEGKDMPMFKDKYWGWLMVIAKPTSWGQGGTIQQIIFNAWSLLIRDRSGFPVSAWTPWRSLDTPFQVIQQDYGNQTIASGYAWKSSDNTINYSGIWLISGCTYSHDSNKQCDYGVFQSTCVVNGTTWLLGNQTLNRAIGKPGAGGSILLWLNKGDKLALRTYYMSSNGGSINTGFNILRAVPVTVQ